jgi:hypothetical protein
MLMAARVVLSFFVETGFKFYKGERGTVSSVVEENGRENLRSSSDSGTI